MEQRYEYRFVRLGEGWMAARREAKQEYQRVVDMAPGDASGYVGLGLVALRAGELDEAERWLLQARERAQEDIEIELARVRIRREQGRLDEARARLTAE